VFAHACKMGLEGIVSKRRESRYHSGRSRHLRGVWGVGDPPPHEIRLGRLASRPLGNMGADWGVPRSTSCETPHSIGTFVLSHRILGWNSISCSGGYGGWGTPPMRYVWEGSHAFAKRWRLARLAQPGQYELVELVEVQTSRKLLKSGCCRDPVACAGMSSLVDNVEYRRGRAEELAEAMKDETVPTSCSELLSTTTGWLTAPRATAASERGWTEAVGRGLSAARKPAS
jgi:hypothetical protein